MSISALFNPDTHLLVGLANDPDGSLRVYLDARYTNRHVHVDDPDAKAEARAAWASRGHVYVQDVPVDAFCDCPEATR